MDTERLCAMAEQMTCRQIAEEEGLTSAGVRSRLARKGVVAVRGKDHPDYRDKVQSMKPAEAVEYLLDCIEVLTNLKSEPFSPYFEGLGLRTLEFRICRALAAATGGFLSREAIYDEIYFDRRESDKLPEIRIVDVYIANIRKKLPASVGEIKTAWGRGYTFIPAENIQE